ncbi:hypothetical protein CRENBAI_010646 [Crenichthys baileyi]|uniref:Uncharacterized protein n=1 Tax=Crenichthys baileyi TaxID=28760 RepID=A0AAV9S571_9TELE
MSAPQPDTPQPDTPQPDTPKPDSGPDTPQPESGPDPKYASTSSTRRRGHRKRDAPTHATEGLGDASAPAHATEGLGDASAPAHAFQGLKEQLVLVLASEPCDEGFEEEAPPDPVPEGDDLMVARLNLVSVSGPPDKTPATHPAWVVFFGLCGRLVSALKAGVLL